MNHFAGSVEYTISGFLNKNKNTLTADVFRTMITSENKLLKKIFTDDLAEEAKPAEEEEPAASPFGAKVGAKNAPKPALTRARTMGPSTSSSKSDEKNSNASKVSVTKKFKTELLYPVARSPIFSSRLMVSLGR